MHLLNWKKIPDEEQNLTKITNRLLECMKYTLNR